MIVKQLIELLQQLDPELVVLVEDENAPRRKDFLADYGFLPQIKCYQSDEGPVAVIGAPAKSGEPSVVHVDDRRFTRPNPRGC